MTAWQCYQRGEVVPHLWAIGDANGKMMLAHAASNQGTAVEISVGDRAKIIKCCRLLTRKSAE